MLQTGGSKEPVLSEWTQIKFHQPSMHQMVHLFSCCYEYNERSKQALCLRSSSTVQKDFMVYYCWQTESTLQSI